MQEKPASSVSTTTTINTSTARFLVATTKSGASRKVDVSIVLRMSAAIGGLVTKIV
jgi:hypothetical protein